MKYPGNSVEIGKDAILVILIEFHLAFRITPLYSASNIAVLYWIKRYLHIKNYYLFVDFADTAKL